MTNTKVTLEDVKANMQDVIVRTLDDFGNCFRTEEEAKAMAEKVKKLLKGE